jgi:hypothetical protein
MATQNTPSARRIFYSTAGAWYVTRIITPKGLDAALRPQWNAGNLDIDANLTSIIRNVLDLASRNGRQRGALDAHDQGDALLIAANAC